MGQQKNHTDTQTDLDQIEDLMDPALDEDLYDADVEAEAWDDHPDGEPQGKSAHPAPRTKKKKKGGLFNLLLIGGGGLVFVALFYTQFMAPKPQQGFSAGSPTQATLPPTEQGAVLPSPVVPQETPSEGPLTPLPEDILAGSPPQPDASGELAVLQKAEPVETVPDVQAPEQQIPAAEPAPAFEETSAPESQSAPQPEPEIAPVGAPVVEEPAPVQTVSPASEAPASATPEPQTPTASADVASTAAPVESAGPDRIQDMEQKLADLAGRLEDTAAASAAPTPDLSGVTTRLDDLAQRLEGLETEMQDLKSAAALAPEPERIPAPVKTKKAPILRAPEPEKPATSQAPKENIYVLRAVSGEVAYVSASPSRTLQAVRVGDTLEGLGKITAIRKQGNAWQIDAEKGHISQ